jgi:integrase
MSVKVREKRGKLYLDIYLGGKRTWEALGLTLTQDRTQNKEIMRLAELCRSKRETQLLSSVWNIQDPIRSKTNLVTYLEEYAKTYENPGSIKSCIRHVKKFNNGSAVQINQITPQWFDNFQKYLVSEANISLTSASSYSKRIRAAFNKAVDNNIILQNPAKMVKPIPEPETELIFLNKDEVQKLADTHIGYSFGAEIRRAFLFACYTGLRISDLETITWRDIETNPMQIIKRQKKTKSPVYIPLHPSAQALIKDDKEHKPTDKVFDLTLEKRQETYKYLKQWVEDAKVNKNVGWHTARKTFATMELENGVDIFTVAKLLGHKTINQVAKYAKVTDKLRRNAVAVLPEIKLQPMTTPLGNDFDGPQ